MTTTREPILSKQHKRVLLLFLPVLLLVSAGLYLIHRSELERLYTKYSEEARERVSVGVASISRNLDWISRDLLYLKEDVELQELLSNPSKQNFEEIQEEWSVFSHNKQIYDKIRWIDETGEERLRINYAEPMTEVVPPEELQNKSARYFFEETIKLNEGRVFVSPLDLNVEQGKVERPFKPTIRLGTPLFDASGRQKGILLINYMASVMLEDFKRAFQSGEDAYWLVNQEGYWLKGSRPEDEFGFMFDRKNLTVGYRYPEEWKQIQAKPQGQFETKDGLWTFDTVKPLLEGIKKHTHQNGKANIESGPMVSAQYEWKAIHFMPLEKYDSGMLIFDIKTASGAMLVLVLFYIGIYKLVRTQMEEERLRSSLEEFVEEQIYEIKLAKERLTDSNIQLESKVAKRTAELASANVALAKLAEQDALTGLANRLAANRRLRHEFLRMKRSESAYAILMMDIDYFKRVNDTFGHVIGDEVIKQIADLVRSSVRETDFVARYGGEEFIAVLPDTGLESACLVGEKIRQTIEASHNETVGHITVSMGVAVANEEQPDENEVIKQADYWLYMAKTLGRNRVMALNYG